MVRKSGTEMLARKDENWINQGKSLGEGKCLREGEENRCRGGHSIPVILTSGDYFEYAL